MNTIVVPSYSFDLAALYDDGVRSILLLDFDDVLNFFPKFFHKELEQLHPNRKNFVHRPTVDRRYKINVDTDVVAVLNESLQDPTVQLVWLTSWMNYIGPVADRCEVTAVRDPLTIVYTEYMDHSASKHAALDDMFWNDTTARFAPEMRLAWVDDRATKWFLDDPDRFADTIGKFGNVRAWTPEQNIGLLLEDARDIAFFLVGDD